MNIFISIKLTQRLGVWLDIDLRYWRWEVYNYCSFCEGRCMSVHIGPIGLGGHFPDAKGEKEELDGFNRAMEKMNGGSNEQEADK